MMDSEAIFREGLCHYRAGRLYEAGQACNAVLKNSPDHADALCLLSAIFSGAGNHALALDLAERAVSVHSGRPEPLLARGNARQANADAEGAVLDFLQATALAPTLAPAWCNLSSALVALGRFAEALEAADKAIALESAMPEAFNNQGNALAGLERREEAATAYRKAIRLRPSFADAHENLGGVLTDLGQIGEGIDACRQAAALAPDDARKHYQLGHALQAADRLEEAASAYMQALKQDPTHMDALNNLGCTFKDLGLLGEAITCFRSGLKAAPEDVDLHWNLSLTLIQKGEQREGWREYEWRWRTPTFAAFRRDFGKPRWNGIAPLGATILIHSEQGFGDHVQFVRFAPMVAATGARVVLECRPGLERLFSAIDGIDQVVRLGDPLPDFDLEVPLMSLPAVFGITLDSVPAGVPYIDVPGGAIADPRIAAAPGLKVGLAWAGSPTRRDNAKRSVPAERLAPLLEVPGVSFFGLQVGPFAKDVDHLPGIIDLAPGLSDFADTAAAIEALDLVISVDTAVAHVAGALGKPCWVLLSRPTGFLWMQDRTDSPWYPTLTLFRQEKSGNWDSPLAGVLAMLQEKARGARC